MPETGAQAGPSNDLQQEEFKVPGAKTDAKKATLGSGALNISLFTVHVNAVIGLFSKKDNRYANELIALHLIVVVAVLAAVCLTLYVASKRMKAGKPLTDRISIEKQAIRRQWVINVILFFTGLMPFLEVVIISLTNEGVLPVDSTNNPLGIGQNLTVQ